MPLVPPPGGTGAVGPAARRGIPGRPKFDIDIDVPPLWSPGSRSPRPLGPLGAVRPAPPPVNPC